MNILYLIGTILLDMSLVLIMFRLYKNNGLLMMYSINKVVDKNKSIGNKDVSMGEKEKVNIQVLNDITVLNNNQKNKRNITYDISINEIKAPVKIGDVVGKIMVYEDGKYLMSENVTVMENIDKANIFKVILRNIRDIIGIKV